METRDISNSVFWNKAKNRRDINSLSSEELLHARRISKFLLIENEHFMINSSDQFLLLPYSSLKFVEINKNALNIGSSKAKKYLSKGLKLKEMEIYPPTIEIGTTTNCTRKCRSCIQYYEDILMRYMDDSTWSQILFQITDQYKSIDREDRPTIHLHWYNEPLLDKNLEQRLTDLQNKNIDNVVLITNGDLLNNNYAIHLSKMLEFLIITAKSDNVYEKFKHFNESNEKVACIDHSKYSNYVVGFNRGGGIYEHVSNEPKGCDKGFNIQIDYNGDIYLCCNDMKKNFSVGNVNIQNIFEVWFSEDIHKRRFALFKGQYIGEPCKHCTFKFK